MKNIIKYAVFSPIVSLFFVSYAVAQSCCCVEWQATSPNGFCATPSSFTTKTNITVSKVTAKTVDDIVLCQTNFSASEPYPSGLYRHYQGGLCHPGSCASFNMWSQNIAVQNNIEKHLPKKCFSYSIYFPRGW